MTKEQVMALEQKMWQAAKDGDKAEFMRLVAPDAVMVCGGQRCTGADYAEIIKDFGISGYEMEHFEVVCMDERIIQVHYVIRTWADCAENADLAGLFHVTSTWENRGGEWRLVFNMDGRIFL